MRIRRGGVVGCGGWLVSRSLPPVEEGFGRDGEPSSYIGVFLVVRDIFLSDTV
jgi:hypothetical protein